MTADGPTVADVATAVYVIPTDAPEADGTLAWNETTMVLVTVRAGEELGIGWSYAAAAAQNLRHIEYFHDHQRIERLLFDGALDPQGGVLSPDLIDRDLALSYAPRTRSSTGGCDPH